MKVTVHVKELKPFEACSRILENNSLSFGARGLLVFLLAQVPGRYWWTTRELSEVSLSAESSVMRLLDELKERGCAKSLETFNGEKPRRHAELVICFDGGKVVTSSDDGKAGKPPSRAHVCAPVRARTGTRVLNFINARAVNKPLESLVPLVLPEDTTVSSGRTATSQSEDGSHVATPPSDESVDLSVAETARRNDNGRFKDFIDLWWIAYEQHFGVAYSTAHAKDFAQTKRLVNATSLSPSALVDVARAAWAAGEQRDDRRQKFFYCQLATRLGSFASNFAAIRAELVRSGNVKKSNLNKSIERLVRETEETRHVRTDERNGNAVSHLQG